MADHVALALEQIRAAIVGDPTVTQQERLILEKVSTLLQGIHATHEKEQQAALGANPAMNHVARVVAAAQQGPQGGPGPPMGPGAAGPPPGFPAGPPPGLGPFGPH